MILRKISTRPGFYTASVGRGLQDFRAWGCAALRAAIPRVGVARQGVRVTWLPETMSAAALMMMAGTAEGQTPNSPMVRIAEIEVDPDQLDAYKAILAEEQEA